MEKVKDLLKQAKIGQIKLSEALVKAALHAQYLEEQEDSIGANRSFRARCEIMNIFTLFRTED